MKNNKGMSLVELLVAVSILSIIMIGIGFVLSAMSKNFATSQKEVQLQDSVQTVYSVVSELIQEAQCDDKGETSVLYSTSGSETHIVVLNKVYKVDSSTSKSEVDTSLSKLYAIGLYKNVLYLKEFSLYSGDKELDYKSRLDKFNDSGTSTATNDFNWNKDVYQDECILSQNVESISIDSENYSNGFVVLSVELKSGTRSADITQNVYLRNSNTAVLAEVDKEGTGTPTPTPTPNTKKLVSISSSSKPESYYAGDVPKLSDFTFQGVYDDGTTGQLSTSEYSCSTIDGTEISESLVGKSISFEFTFEAGISSQKLEVDVKERTSGNTFVLPVASEYIDSDDGGKYNVNTSDDIKVYSYSTVSYPTVSTSTTETITTYDYSTLACNNANCSKRGTPFDASCYKDEGNYNIRCNGGCGSVYEVGSNRELNESKIKYYLDNGSLTCESTTEEINNTSKKFDTSGNKTVTGTLRIRNESTISDYSGVDVIVYFQDGNTTFKNGTVEVTDGSEKTKCTYSFTTDNKYMKIHIPSINKAVSSTSEGKTTISYDTYIIKYVWQNSSDTIPMMATYSISY